MRELLAEFGFDSENTPVIIGSALCALEVGMSLLHITVGFRVLLTVVLFCRQYFTLFHTFADSQFLRISITANLLLTEVCCSS